MQVEEEWPPAAPCKPSFFVVGAPKSGSTSLYEYLARHTSVARPFRKELCYFSLFKRHLLGGGGAANKSQRPMDTRTDAEPLTTPQHYRGLRPLDADPSSNWSSYVYAFQGVSAYKSWVSGRSPGTRPACATKMSFEACPFYLGERQAVARMHLAFPHAKMVAILRNPSWRTVSAFYAYISSGRLRTAADTNATQRVLHKLVASKVVRLRRRERGIESFDMRILTSGIYIHGLSVWGETYPPERMLVLQTERLENSAAATLVRVQDFLGLSRELSPDVYSHKYNERSAARYSSLSAKTAKSARCDTLDLLDSFFASYNQALYAWFDRRRTTDYIKWPNATRESCEAE